MKDLFEKAWGIPFPTPSSNKLVKLANGLQRDSACMKCKLGQTAKTVCLLGGGETNTDIMIVGEAPGQREDESGKPFVGRSGQLLRQTLEEYDLNPDDCFITNAVACRPPDNRKPSKGEINACRSWMQYQLDFVGPKFVLLLGNTPLQSVLGKTGIRKLRGKPIEQDGIIYFPTYHPAFALYDARQQSVFERDIRAFAEIVRFGGIPEEQGLDYTIVDTWDRVTAMLKDLHGSVSCDIETTCLYPWDSTAEIVSIGIGTARKQWIIPAEQAKVWPREDLIEIVDDVHEKLQDCFIIGHNFKFDALWLRVRMGIELNADFDTMLAHYAIDENDLHGLKYLAQKMLGVDDWDIGGQEKRSWSPKNAKYLAHDLYYTRKLRFYFGKRLQNDPEVKLVFDEILMPCSRMFTDAEFNGVYINVDKMDDAEDFLREKKATAEKELNKWGEINWRSPKQVCQLLFGDLGIPIIEKTKKGAPSASESVIKRIEHPIAGFILSFREADKQLSSFIEGWKPYLVNSRIHPSVKLHGTVTGRLSQEHPNLQQVPRDKRIRSLITAPDGWTLVECDLSQIEMRIAAELAGELNMIRSFRDGVDVHWLTAITEIGRGGGLKDIVLATARTLKQDKSIQYADALKILLEAGPKAAAEIDIAWEEHRKKAKAVNFGYLFGMWWKKFKIYARDNYGVIVTDKQAQDSRKNFFELYKFEDWHKRQRKFAMSEGFVRSLSGRKRRLPDAMDYKDTPERAEALRQAINSPVQSFANEINLMAAIQIMKEFPRSVCRLVSTIHDAILLEVRNDYVERVTRRLLEIMKRPALFDVFDIHLDVPIEGEAKIGPWGLGVSLDKWLAAQKTL